MSHRRIIFAKAATEAAGKGRGAVRVGLAGQGLMGFLKIAYIIQKKLDMFNIISYFTFKT
ncbi:MAG: hypothetical protein LBB09_01475 [Rickettsiales bacterium]|jgi:hypothetical protein|nr:hypothetical protein [Rickettsiales bacterium]